MTDLASYSTHLKYGELEVPLAGIAVGDHTRSPTQVLPEPREMVVRPTLGATQDRLPLLGLLDSVVPRCLKAPVSTSRVEMVAREFFVAPRGELLRQSRIMDRN